MVSLPMYLVSVGGVVVVVDFLCGAFFIPERFQVKTLLMFENIVMRFFEFILINVKIELKIH